MEGRVSKKLCCSTAFDLRHFSVSIPLLQQTHPGQHHPLSFSRDQEEVHALHRTFGCSEIEVEVEHVWAAMVVAVRGAQLPHEVGLQQRVRGDPDGAPVEPARRHALLRLDPVTEPLGAISDAAQVGRPPRAFLPSTQPARLV
ncbi:hypothetical protein B296_00019940 [Ensete ventricosum]|uniref:Uncharacterized protein n=1 Tax=Ensete ventricosum TaxID=4639 RepID=A0A426YQU3_ENSVE|nr:hypothetical protein B296_00019940 [Ensete ventricosum]